MGVGLIAHASNDPDGRFCSGAFDYERDGVPTEVGWVADLVKLGILPGELLCPSNGAKTSKAIKSLMEVPLADIVATDCVDKLGSEPYDSDTGFLIRNITHTILDSPAGTTPLAPGSVERAEAINRLMLESGYNTNYAASWFMVRGEFVLDEEGNLATTINGCTDMDPRGRNVTKGPLTLRLLDSGRAVSTSVPLLCDASATGQISTAVGDLAGGTPYALSIVGGPIYSTKMIADDPDGIRDVANPDFLQTPTLAAGTTREGIDGWLKTWSHDTRQDYRGMSPHHSSSCHVLFADGGVRTLQDVNGDQFINNGFDAEPPYWIDGEPETEVLDLASYYSLLSQGPEGAQ